MTKPRIRYVPVETESIAPGDIVTVQTEWGVTTVVAGPLEFPRDKKNSKSYSLPMTDDVVVVSAVRASIIPEQPKDAGIYRVTFADRRKPVRLLLCTASNGSSPYGWSLIDITGRVGPKAFTDTELDLLDVMEYKPLLVFKDEDVRVQDA